MCVFSLPQREMCLCVHSLIHSFNRFLVSQSTGLECELLLEHKLYEGRVFICPVQALPPELGTWFLLSNYLLE